MAITRRDFPTAGGAASFPDDYNNQNNYISAGAITGAGSAYRSIFNNPGETTIPGLKQGCIISHGGIMYIVETEDYTVLGSTTDLSNNYIVLESAGGGATLTATWTTSITGYTYNPVYNGWYNVDGDQVLPEYVYRSGTAYSKIMITSGLSSPDIDGIALTSLLSPTNPLKETDSPTFDSLTISNLIQLGAEAFTDNTAVIEWYSTNNSSHTSTVFSGTSSGSLTNTDAGYWALSHIFYMWNTAGGGYSGISALSGEYSITVNMTDEEGQVMKRYIRVKRLDTLEILAEGGQTSYTSSAYSLPVTIPDGGIPIGIYIYGAGSDGDDTITVVLTSLTISHNLRPSLITSTAPAGGAVDYNSNSLNNISANFRGWIVNGISSCGNGATPDSTVPANW